MAPFVVLEGLDGAGTTTQVRRLVAHLSDADRPVLATHEPTDRTVGRLIRRVLAGDPGAPTASTLPWLFAADRADHLESVIGPAVADGTTVVSDRYYHSSLAYQSLVLPLERVHSLNADFRAPDLTVFLRVSSEVAIGRIDRRGGTREIFERAEQLRRIHAAYDRVLALLHGRGEHIVELDGTLPIDALADRIATLVDVL